MAGVWRLLQVGMASAHPCEDCFYTKLHLGSIEQLPRALNQFLLYAGSTTAIVNATPVRRRDPPPSLSRLGEAAKSTPRGSWSRVL